MTQQNPDEIRADIERTRQDLSTNVDAVTEKVSPSKVAQRQTERVRSTLGGWKDQVMGSADDAGDSAASTAQHAAEAAQRAPHQARRKAEGNPLAAGLIALGAGWLLASLLPPSEAEKQAAAKVKDQAQPLAEEAKSQARSMAEDLKGPAQESAQRVQDSAAQSAETVKAEGQSQKETVTESAQASAEDVRGS